MGETERLWLLKLCRVQLPLTVDLVEALRMHKRDQNERRLQIGEKWVNEGLVFDRGDGAAGDPDELTRSFRAFATEVGCDRRVTLHGLRHYVASVLLDRGLSIAAVSEWMGHSTPAFTAAVYMHAMEGAMQDCADAMAQGV